MSKVANPSSYNKKIVPQELSALAPRLYTCIKSRNLKTFSTLKQLDQCSLDFKLGLLSKGYYQFVQTDLHHLIRWPPCPYMVNILKNPRLTKKASRLNPGIYHRGLKVYQVCSNNDSRLTFDLFTTRSNLRPYAFLWGNY